MTQNVKVLHSKVNRATGIDAEHKDGVIGALGVGAMQHVKMDCRREKGPLEFFNPQNMIPRVFCRHQITNVHSRLTPKSLQNSANVYCLISYSRISTLCIRVDALLM